MDDTPSNSKDAEPQDSKPQSEPQASQPEPQSQSQSQPQPQPLQSPRGRSNSLRDFAKREGGSSEEVLSPRRSNRSPGDITSPRRRNTVSSQAPTITLEPTQSLRRRNTSNRRQSGQGLRPSVSNASHASRRSNNFTLAGPEDTAALRAQHAPFVHPGYAELNPAYDQPANTKPVWSLAKPLPRVVRPGMVPTMSEVQEIREQMPAENAHKEGVNVDPDDLEKGRVKPTANPSKLSAQLKDARAQREHNFIQRHTGTTRGTSQVQSISQIGSRTSSRRSRRRRSTQRPDQEMMSPGGEGDADLASGVAEGHHPTLDPIHEVDGATTSGEEDDEDEDDDDDVYDGIPDDVASMTTLGGDDMPKGELEPIIENIIEEEVHNHHTTWSIIRTRYREELAEFLGVLIQLSVGYSGDLAVTCAKAGNPNTTAWAWGMSTMSAIYVSGGISGAHLNPCITIMLYVYRGFPKRMMPGYFAAQFLGAFVAAFIAYGVYYASIVEYLRTNDASGIVNSFVTSQRYTYIDACTAFFNEFFGAVVLAVVILALGDDSNAPPGAGMNSLIVGLVVFMLSTCFAFQTGAAFNASRDFGPRLALLALGYGKELFTNPYWFYGPWAGALSGVLVGAGLYDVLIFTGGESPINYPWTRTRRAAHKVHKRWNQRFKRVKEEIVS